MVIQLDRASLLKRVLCLLLIAIVLVMSIGVPMAGAVLAETLAISYAQEIIAGILVSSGIVASSQSDLLKMSELTFVAMQNGGSPFISTLLGLAAGAFALGDDIVGKAIRVSADLYQSVCDAFSSVFTKSDVGYTYLGGESITVTADNASDFVQAFNSVKSNVFYYDGIVGYITCAWDDTYDPRGLDVVWHRPDGTVEHAYRSFFSDGWDAAALNVPLYFSAKHSNNAMLVYVYSSVLDQTVANTVFQYPFSSVLPSGVSMTVSGDLTYTGDQTLVLAPPLPTTTADPDTGKEIVVVPPISVKPGDWTADLPKTDTGDLVDVPTDTLVDVGTGEKVDTDNPDVPDENTNIFQRFWDWIKGLLQSILDAIKAIVSAIVGFFDSPSDFRLDFDGFKNLILPERFPFCIPFDLVNSVRVFSANAQDFSFRIDFDTKFFSVHHAVDLTPFVLPIAFFRYTCVIWFCWVLITRTRDMIKW